MQDEIQLAPTLLQFGEGLVKRAVVGDIARQDEFRANLRGQRADTAFKRLALIGEREVRALSRDGLGDAPGNRLIIGDAHDQAFLARHQRFLLGHGPLCILLTIRCVRAGILHQPGGRSTFGVRHL